MRISDWSSDVCSSDLGKFDFVLISGEKQERRLLELNLIRPGDYAFQGYPKFELVAKMAARPLRLFDNDRPTVIYNPHFDPEFSSWPLVAMEDRKGVVKGKSVTVRVELGGSRIIKKKTERNNKVD